MSLQRNFLPLPKCLCSPKNKKPFPHLDKQSVQDCLVELGTLTIRLVDYFSDFQETYLVGRVKTYQAKYGPQDDQQMSDEEDDQLKRILELSKLTATQDDARRAEKKKRNLAPRMSMDSGMGSSVSPQAFKKESPKIKTESPKKIKKEKSPKKRKMLDSSSDEEMAQPSSSAKIIVLEDSDDEQLDIKPKIKAEKIEEKPENKPEKPIDAFDLFGSDFEDSDDESAKWDPFAEEDETVSKSPSNNGGEVLAADSTISKSTKSSDDFQEINDVFNRPTQSPPPPDQVPKADIGGLEISCTGFSPIIGPLNEF